MPGCHILTKSLSDGRAGDEELELAVRKTEWNNISSLETTSRREMLVLSAEFPKTEYCKGKKWHLPQDDYRRRLYNRVVWKERRVQNEGRLPASNVSHSHSFQKWFFNVVVVPEPCRSSLVQTTGRIRLCTTDDTPFVTSARLPVSGKVSTGGDGLPYYFVRAKNFKDQEIVWSKSWRIRLNLFIIKKNQTRIRNRTHYQCI